MSRIHDSLVGRDAGHGPFEPASRIETGLDGLPDLRVQQEMERLQSSLDVTMDPSRRRVVTFLGAVAGEGATTLSLHYALYLARAAEQPVLLVDADMARSSRGLSEGMEDQPGLHDVLRGVIDPAQAVVGTEEERLHFLPAGRELSGYAELVHSPRFSGLLDNLGKRYRVVILDGPPVIAHPEAAIIGAAGDGVVFVIHHRRTRREVIQKAIQNLQIAKCNILGSVLNKRVHDIPEFIYQRV
ncbi:MAG: AAA family ATPase [Candidatus Eisenbacteria bacterium]|nr:AAA family ATPase [Candidatus Eisenbacteria bacterium]